MGIIRGFLVCGGAAAFISFGILQAIVKADDEPPDLKYRLNPDQKIAYAIKIEADMPESKETLSGNAFFTVKSIDDDTGQVTLAVSASLAPRSEHKPGADSIHGGPPRFSSPFNNQQYNAHRQIVIDERGKVVKNDGEAQLPFLLGNLWQLVFEPFPAEPKSSWDADRPIEISSKHGRVLGLPPSFTASDTNRAGHESVHYSMQTSNGTDLTFAKKLELETDEKSGSEPALEQKGEGKFVFDPRNGLIKSVDMKITNRLNGENTLVRIPLTITATMLTADETDKLVAKQTAAIEAARNKAMDRLKPKPMGEAEVAVALIELKDRDMFTVQHACERLALTDPIGAYRKDVCKALEPLLNDRQHFVRINAIKALGVWGTRDSVPALTAIANDNDPFVKEAAKDALVAIMNAHPLAQKK